MNTTKRGKLLMLACAALVAVLACLPLLWFRAQDARMFGTVNQSSGLYESCLLYTSIQSVKFAFVE